MATLTIPLTQSTQYYGTELVFKAPRHWSDANPIQAQHIYSVTFKFVFGFRITNYTAWWRNPQTLIIDQYTGPGQEPREEIPTYWNFRMYWRESDSQTRMINDHEPRKWMIPKEEWASKTATRTEYVHFENMTSQETQTLIERINKIDNVQVSGFYSSTGEEEIAGGTFVVFYNDIEHFYDPVYLEIRKITTLPETCLIIDYLPVGSIKAPSGAYAPSSAPVQNVPILWEEPQKTEQETWDVEITHYAIWRCDTVDGTYVKVGETDGPVLNYSDTTATPGTTWYYKVQACSEEIPLYNSELSAPTAGTYVNYAPEDPDIETGAAGTSYNPRPRILVTLGDDEDNVTLSLAAEGYTPSRATAAPGSKVVFQRTEPMAAGSETVTVSSADPPGNVASEDADVTYTVPTWTDVPIVAGTTVVKAVHINELRAQLENLCDYYGMDAPVWSEDVVAGTTPSVRFTSHATEMQNVARAIANKINTWDAQSSRCNVVLPSLIEPQRPLASVINQLRDIIKIL